MGVYEQRPSIRSFSPEHYHNRYRAECPRDKRHSSRERTQCVVFISGPLCTCLLQTEDGDSGSWVVRNGNVCGFIIGRTIGEPRAYMLPIERVFKEIQQHLKTTLKHEVSDPQTWLGSTTTNEPAEVIIPPINEVIRKDNQLHETQEPVPSQNAPKLPKTASVVTLSRSSSRLSSPETDKGQSVPGDRGTEQISVPVISNSSPPLWSEPEVSPRTPPQGRRLSELSDVSRTRSLHPPASPSQIRAVEQDPVAGPSGLRFPSSKNPDAPIRGGPLDKGEPVTKPVAKQGEKPKSPEQFPSDKPPPPKTAKARRRLALEVLGAVKLFNTLTEAGEPSSKQEKQKSPVDLEQLRVDQNFSEPESPHSSDSLDAVSLEGSSEVSERGTLRRLDFDDLSWKSKVDELLILLQSREGDRANRIAADIMTQVVLFSDLMGQVLQMPRPNARDYTWWYFSPEELQDRLMITAGRVQTELVLRIVAEEVRLIQTVFKHEVRLKFSLKYPSTLLRNS